MAKVLLPHLLKISEFAKIKKVTVQAIYQAINDGRVKLLYVGKAKFKFIDPGEHIDLKFDEKQKRR